MRLLELNPEFLKRTGDDTFERTASIAEADGLLFLCPVCFRANAGSVGTHSVICWQPKVPAHITPGPGRWNFEGTGLADLTLVAGSSSILLSGPGCGAHFFIRNGEIC